MVRPVVLEIPRRLAVADRDDFADEADSDLPPPRPLHPATLDLTDAPSLLGGATEGPKATRAITLTKPATTDREK